MKSFMNQSLKMKWMLTTGLTIFISYAAICIVIYMALHAWLLSDEKNNAERTVEDLSSLFATQGFAVTIQDLQKQTGLMKAILNQDQTVRLYDLNGDEILQINNQTTAATLPLELDGLQTEQQMIDRTDVFVSHQIVQVGPLPLIVQLIHPLTSFQTMMKYILITMCILGVGGVVFAAAISYYASTLLIRPLQDLRNSMLAVKDNGFESKVDFTYTAQDEIGDLLVIYEEMLTQLETAFKRQQQFVSDASHELRTPVQSLEGHLSLMKRWGKDDPDVLNESLSTSLEEVTRMKKMLEELLQLARQEQVSEDVMADVVAVAKKVEEDLHFIHPNTVFSSRVVGQVKQACMTEEALGQILRNLYENAIRYTEKQPTIETIIHFEEQRVFIEITDNGIGVAGQDLPFIFDRFYKVDDARLHVEGSTGLGLSIVKMLVEKYHGKIEVHSQIGKGTVFLLHFPLKL